MSTQQRITDEAMAIINKTREQLEISSITNVITILVKEGAKSKGVKI